MVLWLSNLITLYSYTERCIVLTTKDEIIRKRHDIFLFLPKKWVLNFENPRSIKLFRSKVKIHMKVYIYSPELGNPKALLDILKVHAAMSKKILKGNNIEMFR